MSRGYGPTRKFHSESLDRKIAAYGYCYGSKQGEETLDMVGRVDVEGILAELANKELERKIEKPEEKPVPVPIAYCEYCGGPVYEVNRKRRGRPKMYCSESCKSMAWRKRNGMKTCEYCGSLFVPHFKAQRTCSNSCGQKLRIKETQEKRNK